MTLEWDEETIGFQTNIKDLTSKPPRIWTIQREEFCPICNNPKTLINKIKIKKYLNSHIKKFQFLLDHLKEKNLKRFTIEELIKSLNAENLTEGTLQRKILTILVSLGYFRRINEELEDKHGKKRLRYVFVRNEVVSSPQCYDFINDKHKEVEWVKKTIFDPKGNKKEKLFKEGEEDDTRTT